MADLPWYVEFFDRDYLRLYTPLLTPERTEQEVTYIVDLLQLPPGSTILDLCCGHGRHSILLAQRGYRVTGLDLSQVFLDKARSDAQDAGVQVRWVRGDMRQIPFQAEFDAVINVFTAFGYLENEQEDQKVLHRVQGALKPGGLFLLDTIHRASLLRRFQPQMFVRYKDGRIVLHQHHFDMLTSRINDDIMVIEPDGTRLRRYSTLRLYTLRELAQMLEAAGLRLEAHYGGLDGSDLTLDSRRLVLLSRKPQGHA